VTGFGSLRSGVVFAGDYRIVRPLAEGGMGAVYVAEQLSTGRQRALKVMHPSLVPDERSRERFAEEAKLGARIDSEHVVEVVGAGVDATTGMPWLSMELLEGSSFEDLVQESGPLPPRRVFELLEQVCHALADAHRKGIIHRDLKPENLFLARSRRSRADSTVKILDFGIARTVEESRTAAIVTSAIGSPLWMAPEQAQPGAKLRPSTDVWALGLIAFYLLTGRTYWRSSHGPEASLSALLVEILTGPIVAPSVRAAELGSTVALPPGFDAWFLRCVEREPGARFMDAGLALVSLAMALEPAPLAGSSLVHTIGPPMPLDGATLIQPAPFVDPDAATEEPRIPTTLITGAPVMEPARETEPTPPPSEPREEPARTAAGTAEEAAPDAPEPEEKPASRRVPPTEVSVEVKPAVERAIPPTEVFVPPKPVERRVAATEVMVRSEPSEPSKPVERRVAMQAYQDEESRRNGFIAIVAMSIVLVIALVVFALR
jgi:serine/threonine protein kinase